MPLFRPNMVVLQPIFYMFTRCMLCMEKNSWNLGKINWTHGKFNENYGKPMNTLGKSMNTMEKPTKIMEHRWTVQMANFWAPKVSKVQVFAPNVANSKEKCPRLKKKTEKKETLNPNPYSVPFYSVLFYSTVSYSILFYPRLFQFWFLSVLFCFAIKKALGIRSSARIGNPIET